MTRSEVKKDSFTSWFYLTFVGLVTFFVFGFLDSYGVLLVFLVRHFDEKNSKAAWVGSSAMFGCFFLYPFALRLRYKYGIRATVLVAGALLLPLFILSPMVPSMNLLFLTFSLPFAIAGSIIDCATFTTILEHFDKHKGFAFGVRLGTNALGMIMFSWSLPVLLSEIQWKHTFWILTGICFITICYGLVYSDSQSIDDCALRTGSSDSMESLPKDVTRDDIKVYYELLQNKELVVFLIANTVFIFVIFMPPVFMVQFASNLGHHISKSKWLNVTRGIIAVVVRFTAGRFVDIASRRRKVRHVALTVTILFSLSTLICSMTTSFSMLMFYMAFVSIVDSIHWLIIPLLVSEITKGVHTENAVALFNCVASFATLGGPPFLGWIYDNTGDFRPVMYTTSAVSAVAACLIMIRLLCNNKTPDIEIEELINQDTSLNIPDDGMQTTVVYVTDYKQQLQFLSVV